MAGLQRFSHFKTVKADRQPAYHSKKADFSSIFGLMSHWHIFRYY
jgi:hypothetical protein